MNKDERADTSHDCLACGETYDCRAGIYGNQYFNGNATDAETFCLCEGCFQEAGREGVLPHEQIATDVLSAESFATLKAWALAQADPFAGDDAATVLRAMAENMIEMRNSTGEHEERLALVDGGVADELLNRANRVLGGTLPKWT